MFITGDVRTVEPLKSTFPVSSEGDFFLEFHSEDSDAAEVMRPFNSGIYSMFPVLEGEDVTSLRSDSASPTQLGDRFDTFVKGDSLRGNDRRFSGVYVDTSNEDFPGVGDKSGGVGLGVGGCKLMMGTLEGDSMSLFLLDV